MSLFFGRTSCDLQIPYKVDPNPWKQHQNWVAIERWATYFARNCAGGCAMEEIQWSQPSTLDGSTSPPWQSEQDRTLVAVKALCNTPDPDPVEFTFYRNGDTITSLTMPAGENVVKAVDLSANFGADGEFLTFAVTDLGAGTGSGWTVIAYFDCGGEPGAPPDPPIEA